jgi:hypothetical protein
MTLSDGGGPTGYSFLVFPPLGLAVLVVMVLCHQPCNFRVPAVLLSIARKSFFPFCLPLCLSFTQYALTDSQTGGRLDDAHPLVCNQTNRAKLEFPSKNPALFGHRKYP